MPRFLIALVALALLNGCATSASTQQETTLKVAISDNFKPVMEELARDYTARAPWVKIELHSANTAKLDDDLKNGAAFDLYVPGRVESLIALINSDAMIPKSQTLIAINQLVLIAPPDSSLTPGYTSLLNSDVRQIAVADPSQLLGFLTRQSLTNLNYLPVHQSAPLVTPTAAVGSLPNQTSASPPPSFVNLEPKLLVLPDEASIVAAIKDGRAQIGIVYMTTALPDKKVLLLGPMRPDMYEPIQYAAAIPRNTQHYDEAWQFLNYLRSKPANDIMQRNGLQPNF